MRNVRSSGKAAQHGVVDLAERGKVVAQRFLKRDARLFPGQSRRSKPGDGRLKQRGAVDSRIAVVCVPPLRRAFDRPPKLSGFDTSSGDISETPQKIAACARQAAIGRQIFRERRFGQRAKAIVRPCRCAPCRVLQDRAAGADRHGAQRAKAATSAAPNRRWRRRAGACPRLVPLGPINPARLNH